MTVRRILAALLLASTATVLGGAGPAGARPADDAGARGQVVSVRPAPSSPSYPDGTIARTITYLSAGSDGRLALVSGLVLVPPGHAPHGGWPVIAWDHGTTGIGDGCAPSSLPGAAYPTELGAFLRAGYAVAATDYRGLGTPGAHPYLVAPDEALATVDIVRAAHRVDPLVSTRWVAVGHSQGGQAAWAADELPPRERAGTAYRGSVALAPAPNLGPLLSGLRHSTDPLVQEFVLMLLVGLHTQVDLDYRTFLGPDARAALPAVRTLCFDDLTELLAARHIPGRDILPRSAPLAALARDLRPYEIAHRRTHEPMLVLQGLADQVVPPASTRSEVAEEHSRGGRVTLRTYPHATHGSVLVAAWTDVMTWLADRFGR